MVLVATALGCGDSGPLAVVETGRASLGLFEIVLTDKQLRVHHEDQEHSVYESPVGDPFISAAVASDDVESLRGSFTFRERERAGCVKQRVSHFEVNGDRLMLSGTLKGPNCRADYELIFRALSDNALDFEIRVTGEGVNRVALTAAAERGEHIFGMGTQYSRVDLKGSEVPVWVREQGLGRGLEPLTSITNLLSPGAGGDWHTSYAPLPFFVSSSMRSLALESTEYAEFDFELDHVTTIEQWTNRMVGRIYAGDSPNDFLRANTELMGRMHPLPAWARSGAVPRVYGGEAEVLASIESYRNAGVPITGVWIEDWVGERDTFTGSRLWWNWEADSTLYPNWADFVRDLRAGGIEVMIYFNPFLADVSEKENFDRNLFAEAESMGYLVTDSSGDTYLIEQGGFDAAMVDLSNPAALNWYEDLMRIQLSIGVSGWMADFGEALPWDAELFEGDAKSFHNRYPVAWAELGDRAIAGSGRDDVVPFHRSGYTGSAEYARLFWLGDQTVSWDEFDGIKTVVRGLISAGISGYTINHSDIGGYLSVDQGDITILRSKELLLRWIELAAFTSFFRTHESNERDKNHQVYTDPETLDHFARFAQVYAALTEYRLELMNEAESAGLPVVRHTWLIAPEDPEAALADQQFFLGDDLLIAPVLDPDTDSVSIYLPAGEWKRVGGATLTSIGEQVTVAAPIGNPAVFYGADFAYAEALEGSW